MNTIKNLRALEGQLTKQNRVLRDAVSALMSSGNPTPAAAQALAAAAALVAPPAAPAGDDPTILTAVAGILGVDASDGPGVVEAAKQSRLSAELGELIHAHNLDMSLTRSLINSEKLLVGVEVGASDLHNTLTNMVHDLGEKHPNLRLRSQAPAVAGVPMPSGSGGATPPVSREQLKFLSAETITHLRQSGQLLHLDVGPDRP